MLFSNIGKLFFVSQIGTGIIPKIWYPPGNLSGYIEVEAPPIPNCSFWCPCSWRVIFWNCKFTSWIKRHHKRKAWPKTYSRNPIFSSQNVLLQTVQCFQGLFNSVISSGSNFFFAILFE